MRGLRQIIVSLFTRHLLAKFFALLFASVTIYFIDRYQNDPVTWVEKGLLVVPSGDTDAPSDEIHIVVRPDAGLAFLNHPKTLRLRVRGPKQERPKFVDSIQRIELRGVLDWTDAGDQTREAVTRLLTPQDFTVPELSNAEVVLLETAEVTVDRIVQIDGVRMELEQPSRDRVPNGMRLDPERTMILPERVSIRGPRSLVRKFDPAGAAEPLPVALPPQSDLFESGRRYTARIAGTLAKSVIFAENRKEVTVDLVLSEVELVNLELREISVLWMYDEETRQNLDRVIITPGGAAGVNFQARVTLAGPSRVVEPLRVDQERMRKLADELRVGLDPEELKAAVTTVVLEGRENQVSIPLVVDGIPADLIMADLSPREFTIVIRPKPKKD